MTVSQDPKTPNKKAHVWVSSTYFAEGFPYAIVHQVAEVLFKEMGASLQAIGLTALFHLPWNLKFLWGPFLDIYGTKRKWLLLTELVLCVFLIALALGTGAPSVLWVCSILFFMIAVVAATHDIAIDGYYLESLDEQQQSQFVGYRATAYKLAMLLVSGPLLMAIAFTGWFWGCIILAAVMALLFASHLFLLPKTEQEKRPIASLFRTILQWRVLGLCALILGFYFLIQSTSWTLFWSSFVVKTTEKVPIFGKMTLEGWIGILLLLGLLAALAALPWINRRVHQSESQYALAFVDFLEQPKVARILAFVLLFRAGESLLLKMRYPFFSDMGMDLTEFSFASGTLGVVFSFTGTLLGGYCISRQSLKKWIWPFVIAQNSLNLLFAGTAYWVAAQPDGFEASLGLLTAIIGLESFGSGLGTAVFMVYLMRCCRPGFKAAHMAIVTALMSVSFTLAGVSSGYLAAWLDYGHYFFLSFVLAVPGMILIPFLPYLNDQRQT